MVFLKFVVPCVVCVQRGWTLAPPFCGLRHAAQLPPTIMVRHTLHILSCLFSFHKTLIRNELHAIRSPILSLINIS